MIDTAISTPAPPPPPPPPAAAGASQKRPAEEDAEDGEALPSSSGDALRVNLLQEIRNFKPGKKRKSTAGGKLNLTPEEEARNKRR